MTSKSTIAFRRKICSLQQAVKIHGATLTIHRDGLNLISKGVTLTTTWEDAGEILGGAWDDFFGSIES